MIVKYTDRAYFKKKEEIEKKELNEQIKKESGWK